MKMYTHTIRWAVELTLLCLALAFLPGVYRTFSSGSYPYYDPGPEIAAMAGQPYDKPGAVRTIVNGKVAVFTEILFPLYKGYPFIPDIWRVDLDYLYTARDQYYQVYDSVEYMATTDPGEVVVRNWTTDTSSQNSRLIEDIAFGSGHGPGIDAITFRVRDTYHCGPPGTTDDPSDWVGTSSSIEWVIPTSETQQRDFCGLDPEPPSGFVCHLDRYSITLHNGDVSFVGLYVKEIVQFPGGQEIKYRQIEANNHIEDYLSCGYPADLIVPTTLTVIASQQFYIGPTSPDGPWVPFPYTNTCTQKLLGGQTGAQGRSKRKTDTGTAQCADWEDALHQ